MASDPKEIQARLETYAALGGTLTGDEVLGQVHAAFTEYIVFTSPEAADAVTLYVAATHAQPAWQHATRLVVKSAEKRCGKSRVFDVARELVHRPLPTVNISAAALVRSIDKDDPPTLIWDEADRTFGGTMAGAESTAVAIGIINAGFARDWPYIRWDPTIRDREECPSFAMAMLAVKGVDLPDTIEDRAVIITMRRKLRADTVTRWRGRQAIPPLRALRDQLAGWAIPLHDSLGDSYPAMPDGLDDRAEDLWEPLFAVADAAGGSWPVRARRAAQVLAAERAETDGEGSFGVKLLADIRELFGRQNVSFLQSKVIVAQLRQQPESPWGDMNLTVNQLADRLRRFGIRPGRNAAGTARGYRLDDFRSTFDAYLDDPS